MKNTWLLMMFLAGCSGQTAGPARAPTAGKADAVTPDDPFDDASCQGSPTDLSQLTALGRYQMSTRVRDCSV